MKPVLLAAAVVVLVVLVWLAADFVYSRVVAYRLARWEGSVGWDENGVQLGKAAFDVGEGDTAVLLVHGIGDSPRAFRKMAPRLAEGGFACRAMRLPGFAESTKAYGCATSDEWVDAVAEELVALREKHERVVIVAHSLGAAVVIRHLTDAPGAAAAAVLIAPLVEISNRRSPVLSVRAWHEFGKRAFLFTRVTETPFRIDAKDPAEREYEGRAKFTPRRVFDEVFDVMDANRGRESELTVPLMMVLSPHDRVIDGRAARRFFDRAASPVKTIRTMEEAAHAMPVDTGWEILTAEIVEFLRAH